MSGMIFSVFTIQNLYAKISVFSPWSFQDRLSTQKGKIDQSVCTQFGMNGITPPGSDTDSNFINFPYQFTYGLIDKVELGAGWGLLMSDRKNKSKQFGISDLMIAGRYRFFDANRSERTPGLDMEMGFSLPTASFDKGLGTGALGIHLGWGLVLPLDPVRAHFGLGYRINLENSDDVRVGSVFSYNGGITLPMTAFKSSKKSLEPFSLTAELKGMNHARNKRSGTKEGPAPDELYLSPGMEWNIKNRFQLHSALLIGLTTDSSDIGMNIEFRF